MKLALQIAAISACLGVLATSGCDAPQAPHPEQAPERAQPKPNPSRDEAAELVKACGAPTTDKRKHVQDGIQRILSWHRSGVDVFFIQNAIDSPKWASTAVFVGEDTIDRKTLSRKMPCSKNVSLFSVDVLDQ